MDKTYPTNKITAEIINENDETYVELHKGKEVKKYGPCPILTAYYLTASYESIYSLWQDIDISPHPNP